MSEWFESKVTFLRVADNGLIRKVTERYLVDSNSFTECEERVIREQGDGVREVTVSTIARSTIKEVVFYGDTDQWFKVKLQYSLMDEESEKEKKVTTYLLVNANDIKEAYERTEEHLKEMLVPFKICKIDESPICDVWKYKSKLSPDGDDAPATFSPVTAKAFPNLHPVYGSEIASREASTTKMIGAFDNFDPTNGQAVPFDVEDDE